MNLLRKYYDTDLGGGGVPDEVRVVKCPDCFGDGVETCHNPDHGFLNNIMSGFGANESACPCCGHNPEHKMKGKCETCSGKGLVSFEQYEKYIDEFVEIEDRDLVHEHCIAKHIASKNEEISRLKAENERLRGVVNTASSKLDEYIFDVYEICLRHEKMLSNDVSMMLDTLESILIPPPPKPIEVFYRLAMRDVDSSYTYSVVENVSVIEYVGEASPCDCKKHPEDK